MQSCAAYMALNTYPECAPDHAILAAVDFVAVLGCTLSATAFAVKVPQLYSPMGGLLLDVPALARSAEDRSGLDCRRLVELVTEAAADKLKLQTRSLEVILGAARDAAAAEARYFNVVVLPWSSDTVSIQDFSESIIFESGRPTILVPSPVETISLDHIAIAWDGSRFATRALHDALPYLKRGGQVSIVTVQDEKPLSGPDLAKELASRLATRGYDATSMSISLDGRSIARALQEAALSEGAKLLAMGGFGHSRLRDFVLGGATKGVLRELRLPVLLSH